MRYSVTLSVSIRVLSRCDRTVGPFSIYFFRYVSFSSLSLINDRSSSFIVHQTRKITTAFCPLNSYKHKQRENNRSPQLIRILLSPPQQSHQHHNQPHYSITALHAPYHITRFELINSPFTLQGIITHPNGRQSPQRPSIKPLFNCQLKRIDHIHRFIATALLSCHKHHNSHSIIEHLLLLYTIRSKTTHSQ